MNKDVIPKLVFLVLIIVLVATIIIAANQKERDMTLKLYSNLCDNSKYMFAMTEQSEELNYTLTVAENENSLSIDVESNDEHTTTLVLDETAYYVMHNEKEYYLYDSSLTDGNIIKNGLSKIKDSKYTSGTEDINGKNYYYEEYDDIVDFMIWLDDDEENKIKTRFYYDKNKIAYIKTIVDDGEELLKINFSDKVDDNLFYIPDDYAEM